MNGPWAAEFQRVHDSATTDLVRDIVSDGELTLGEMREAATWANRCFDAVGSPAAIIESRGGSFLNVLFEEEDARGYPSEAVRTGSIECEFRYWNDLWVLWDMVRLNPDAEDFDELVVDCLVRNGLAAEALSVQVYRESSRACEFRFEDDPDNPISDEEFHALLTAHWHAHQDCRPQLPCGLYLDEGEAWDCRMDPRAIN